MTLPESPGEVVVKVQPYKCNKQYGQDTEMKLSKRVKEFIKKTWDYRTKITVEPLIVCYVLPSMLTGLAVQNICLEKSCLVNLNYDEVTCRHIMKGITGNHTVQEREVQGMVTRMTAWSFPIQAALPGIFTLFIGAWSDRTGNRKTFMVLPILGKLISVIGLILSTIFFFQVGLNETALIEGLPPALAGGRIALTMAIYSYVADITSESERTFRLGIITAILTLSRPIGMALSGYMTSRLGYYGVFTFACMFYMIGLVYIVVRLKGVKTKKVEEVKKTSVLVHLVQDVMATVNVAIRKRPGSHRLQIFLVLSAYMFIVGPVLGEAQMTYWFTRYKFKFTEVDYSLFLAYSVIVGSVGSIITIYLFSKKWKMEDSTIGVLACASRIAATTVYAISPTPTVFFIGPFLDMFSSAGAACLRSMITKLVNEDEIGKSSSLISMSEALVPVIYSPVYSKVYLSTISTFAGAFYFISAGLAAPAIVILIILFALRRKETCENSEKSPESKTKDNEITRF